jgi:hypothetical protein
MEREHSEIKYMVVNCEGSQSPARAVELRKKEKCSSSIIIYKEKHLSLCSAH